MKGHLESLLVKSPAPERQGRGDALGSVQGKKAQGLIVQQASTLWRGAWVGHKRGRWGGWRGALQGGSFAPFSQQNVTGASHSGFIFSKSKYLRKVGTFSETGQVREHSKE